MNKDYTLERQPQDTKKEEEIKKSGMPVYMERLKLSEDQKKRLVEQFKAEFQVIKEQREQDSLEKKWQALDNQYDGIVTYDELSQFNLNKNVTKVKVDAVVTAAKEAFFETDPIFAVTPRPGFYKREGQDICVMQQDFLDYKVDNLPIEPEMDLVFHSAVCKGTGILKLFHDIEREKRKREETYEPTMVPVLDALGNPVINQKTNLPVLENKGLKEFLSNWPNAAKDYPGLVEALLKNETITFVADYKETVYNDPRPKFIDLKDFYVRKNVNGYSGLKTTRFIAERQNYTYWELKQEENDNKFEDIDKLIDKDDKGAAKDKNYENLDWDVFECVYYFKLNPEDKEETKILFWISEKNYVVLGCLLYPYYAIPACYIPFYIKRKKTGFYQPGLAEDLTDSNLAENAILNLTLEGAHITNTVTPITKNQDVRLQFLEKRFAHGVPLNAAPNEVDFLNKSMRPTDINGLVMLLQYLVQGDDDITRVSSLMSGRETGFDPTAPASKTAALLQQSGRGVNDYIRHLIPSFNEIGYILLAIYYQMSKEGQKYTIRPENVVNGNPFGVLERSSMIARTNIQARAYAFEQDKVNEKALDLSLYQLIRQEPLIAKNPDAVYTMLKNLVEDWSVKWKNISTKIVPTLDDFKKMQIRTAMQGVAMFVQSVMQNAQVTGVIPEFPVDKLLEVISDLEAQLVTPLNPDIVKQQEKAANGR
jgi:hypothetical protein